MGLIMRNRKCYTGKIKEKPRRTLLYLGSPTNNSEITLTDSLLNYDEIMVIVKNGETPYEQVGTHNFPIEVIEANKNLNNLLGWCDGTVKYALSFAIRRTSDTKFNVTYATCGGWGFGSLTIYGIKY